MKKILYTLILLLNGLTAFAQTDQLPAGTTTPLANIFRWLYPADTSNRQLYLDLGKNAGVQRYERIPRYHDLGKYLTKIDTINFLSKNATSSQTIELNNQSFSIEDFPVGGDIINDYFTAGYTNLHHARTLGDSPSQTDVFVKPDKIELIYYPNLFGTNKQSITLGNNYDVDPIIVNDYNTHTGIQYGDNWNTNQLLNDRNITDVGGIKQLITTYAPSTGSVSAKADSARLYGTVLPTYALKNDPTTDLIQKSFKGNYLQMAYNGTVGTPPAGYGNIGFDVNGSEIITKANGNTRTFKLPYAGNVNAFFPNAGTIHLADRDSVAAAYVLLNGRSGGQTIIGGTGASELLKFTPTSNATRGSFQFGDVVPDVNTYFEIGAAIVPNTTPGTANFLSLDPVFNAGTDLAFQQRAVRIIAVLNPNGHTITNPTGFTTIYARPQVKGTGSVQTAEALFGKVEAYDATTIINGMGLGIESASVFGTASIQYLAGINVNQQDGGSVFGANIVLGAKTTDMSLTGLGFTGNWSIFNPSTYKNYNASDSYFGGNVGIGSGFNQTPRRQLDIVSTSAPQFRTTYTDNSVYTDHQTNSTGNYLVNTTGGKYGFNTGTTDAIADIEIDKATTDATPVPVDIFGVSTTNAGAWSTTLPFGRIGIYSKDISGAGVGFRAGISAIMGNASGDRTGLALHYSSSTTAGLIGAFLSSAGNFGIGGSNMNPSALLDIAASPTTAAAIRIRAGSAPTSPNSGDIWNITNFLKYSTGTVTTRFLRSNDATPSNGQIPIGGSGNDLTMATLTSGNNIGITNGAGTITIASSIQTIRLTGSGTGAATTISVAHGLSGVSTSSIVVATPYSTAAGGYINVTIDATNVNFIYSAAPVSGTNNLIYNVTIKP